MQNVGDTSAGRGNCRTRPVGLARVGAPPEHNVNANRGIGRRPTRISGEIKMIITLLIATVLHYWHIYTFHRLDYLLCFLAVVAIEMLIAHGRD